MPSKRKRETSPKPESLNAIEDLHICLKHTRIFLEEYPREEQITIALIYNLYPVTLQSYLVCLWNCQYSGQNKILNIVQTSALYIIIYNLIGNLILPTFQLVYNIIYTLKRIANTNFKAPSTLQFTTWWKNSGLWTVTTQVRTKWG